MNISIEFEDTVIRESTRVQLIVKHILDEKNGFFKSRYTRLNIRKNTIKELLARN